MAGSVGCTPVHSASTQTLSLVTAHTRRGTAMDDAGVLPVVSGVAVHDGWKPYQHYHRADGTDGTDGTEGGEGGEGGGSGPTHALGTAHHLRELAAVTETAQVTGAEQDSADGMARGLTEIHHAVCQGRAAGGTGGAPRLLATYQARYDTLIRAGHPVNPTTGTRGKTVAANLLHRLDDHRIEVGHARGVVSVRGSWLHRLVARFPRPDPDPGRQGRSSLVGADVSGRRFGRYTVGARCYDVVSGEWPVYRAGRRAGVEMLGLQPGDRVLDLGCGTGLNFGLLEAAVGPTGTIVGVDLSAAMLAQADARKQRHGWANVSLVQADAGSGDLTGVLGAGSADAALFTYALSVIDGGVAAWLSALAATRAGGRVAVVDLALPAGGWAVLAPLARIACFTGGVDLDRKPWRWVVRDTRDVEQRMLRAGHIQVAAGTVPART